MRGVLLTDLDAAARAILAVAPDRRAETVRAMLDAADTADRYRRRLGRILPGHGNGSLMSAARNTLPGREVERCDPDYCAALMVVLQELAVWRGRSQR